MEQIIKSEWLVKRKLSRKLLGFLAYCLLIVGLLTISINHWLIYIDLENQIEKQAQSIAQGLEFATEGLIEVAQISLLERVVQNYATLNGVLGVGIINPDGDFLAYSPNDVAQHFSEAKIKNQQLSKIILQSATTGIETNLKSKLHGEPVLIYFLPFSSVLFAQAERRGLTMVIIDIKQIEDEAWEVFSTSLITLISGIIVILMVMGFLIEKNILKPLHTLYQAVLASQNQDFFRLPSTITANEIGFLARVIKEQFNQLKKYNEQLRQEIYTRRKTEEELRQSQQLLKLVMDNIPQAIFWKDCQSVYLGCNKTFSVAANLNSPEEIVGKTDYDLPWSKGQSDWYRQCDRQVITNNTPQYHIIENISLGNGQQIWIDTNKVPLHDAEGLVMGILGTYEDITQRKQLEEEREKALAKEREINEQKTKFINIVSHEFRNPLTGILSSAELLERYSDRLTPEKKINHINNIKNSANRLNEMVNDLLVISYEESGKIKLNLAPLDLENFCLELIQEMKIAIGQEHIINLTVLGFPENSKVFWLDKKILRHIINNLLSNAIKYSPPSSEIDFQLEYQEKQIIFQISDRGLGIFPEDCSHIFESFHRGKNIGNISGTGLGLHIVKRYVDLCKGEINFTSQVGVGTTFKVTIPI